MSDDDNFESAYEPVKREFEKVIVEGMARGLWLSAFMNWAEEAKWHGVPMAGGDWDEVTPPTPEAADKAAHALAMLIASSEGLVSQTPMTELFSFAMLVEHGDEFSLDPAAQVEPENWVNHEDAPTTLDVARAFGMDIAMQSLGHGVSWGDNHRTTRGDLEFDPDLPSFEVNYDGEYLVWSGESGSRGIEQAIGPRVPGFTYVNEGDESMRGGHGGMRTFVLTFQGDYLVIYAWALEDALDEMIEWVVDAHPDALVDDQVNEAFRDALQERGINPDDDLDWNDNRVSDAMQEAEADTTSGGDDHNYINSDDWSIVGDDVERDDLIALAKSHGWIKANPSSKTPLFKHQVGQTISEKWGESKLEIVGNKYGFSGWLHGKDGGGKLPVPTGDARTASEAMANAKKFLERTVSRSNPAGLTGKGERMYQHVKAGYGRSPRAKEIASRTVLGAAKRGVPGLVRNPRYVTKGGQPVTVHGVLAGAYRGKSVSERELLTHASTDGGITAICRKVKEDALCDVEEDGPPTCKTCLTKLESRRP